MGWHPLPISFCQFSYFITQVREERERSKGRREIERERTMGTPPFHSMSTHLQKEPESNVPVSLSSHVTLTVGAVCYIECGVKV